MSQSRNLRINGDSRMVDAPDDMPLLWLLGDVLGMTRTKSGCGVAQCGACTVHLDGQPVRSCLLPVAAAEGKPITAIEGLGRSGVGVRVQRAWLDLRLSGRPRQRHIEGSPVALAAAPARPNLTQSRAS